ncbi:MAG: ATP-binding protein [Thermoplasmata archaeon]|nr:ATP-binding protein [Thermoplasmata archaeon]
MFEVRHPEVLARDWLPPVASGREAEVAEVVRRLDPPAPRAPPPWIVAVAGARGTGTSTVARRAARTLADLLRAGSVVCVPRLIPVRTAGLRGAHGVASSLLRHLDPGFDGRGFSVVEVLAGFLRRIRREARPMVLVLDDIGVGGPDLGPLLRALGNPDRFLPEGENGIPPTWTLLAGTPEGLRAAEASLEGHCSIGPTVDLGTYPDRTLATIVRDRAERSLGRPVPPALITRIVTKAVEEGASAGFALELLRRELLGGVRGSRARLPYGLPSNPVAIEAHVVRAIESAVRGQEARVGEVRRWEAEFAEAEGSRPLPATTLWRRIVRLEQAGYLRREIRPGGVGGTRSVVRVLTPVDEWVTSALRVDTRRDGGSWVSSRWDGSAAPSPAPALGSEARPPSARAD